MHVGSGPYRLLFSINHVISCVFDILCTRGTILPLRFLPLRKSLFLGALTSSTIGQDSSTSLAVDQNSAEKGFESRSRAKS